MAKRTHATNKYIVSISQTASECEYFVIAVAVSQAYDFNVFNRYYLFLCVVLRNGFCEWHFFLSTIFV